MFTSLQVNIKQTDQLSDALAAIEALSALVAEQGKQLATHTEQAETLRQEVSGLKQAMQYVMAPVQRDTISSGDASAGGNPPPSIEGDGTGLALRAPAGMVVIESSECTATDLCGVAQDVRALMKRFGDKV